MLARSPRCDELGEAAGGEGGWPTAYGSKLERTAMAAEDGHEHTVPCLIFWLPWELEGKIRRRSARLIEERHWLELATAGFRRRRPRPEIGAGLRRCSIKWAEMSRRGRERWCVAREGSGGSFYSSRRAG